MPLPELLAVPVVGALLFVAAEFWARARLRRRMEYFVLDPCRETVLEVDRETLPGLEPTVRIAVNSAGERGDELPRDRAGLYRVLVAGGSAAECYMLDHGTAWPHVVQDELAARADELGARHVHVGNVGRSLVACDAVNVILQRVLPRYERLDLVILMVGASDVVAWLEQRTPAVLEESRTSTDYLFDRHPEGSFGWGPSTLALRQVLSRLHKRVFRPVGRRTRTGASLAKHRAMRARAAVAIDSVPDPAPMLEYFERHLTRTIETARTKADRVLVVRQPWLRRDFTPDEDAVLWNFGAGRPYMEEVTTYYSHGVVNQLLEAVDEAADRVVRTVGVEQVTLMDALEPTFENFYDRLHFTPQGARVVGRVVARAVLDGGQACGGDAQEAAEEARPVPSQPPR